MDLYQVINKPLVTEKGTTMLSDGNWVTFKVHMDSNNARYGKKINCSWRIELPRIRKSSISRLEWKHLLTKVFPRENM